jgi:hypothetical protein
VLIKPFTESGSSAGSSTQPIGPPARTDSSWSRSERRRERVGDRTGKTVPSCPGTDSHVDNSGDVKVRRTGSAELWGDLDGNEALIPCPALNTHVAGFALCSLRKGTHDTHQLRCDDTGELLGEWTDADMTFREPANEPRRAIEFSDSQFHYGDVA